LVGIATIRSSPAVRSAAVLSRCAVHVKPVVADTHFIAFDSDSDSDPDPDYALPVPITASV
jgi:hypothetical protein